MEVPAAELLYSLQLPDPGARGLARRDSGEQSKRYARGDGYPSPRLTRLFFRRFRGLLLFLFAFFLPLFAFPLFLFLLPLDLELLFAGER